MTQLRLKIGDGGPKIRHGGVPASTGGVTRWLHGHDTPANRQKLYRNAHQHNIAIGHTRGHQWTLPERCKLWFHTHTGNPQPFIAAVDDALAQPILPEYLVDDGTSIAVYRYNDLGLIWAEHADRPLVRLVAFADLVAEAERVT